MKDELFEWIVSECYFVGFYDFYVVYLNLFKLVFGLVVVIECVGGCIYEWIWVLNYCEEGDGYWVCIEYGEICCVVLVLVCNVYIDGLDSELL